MEFDTIVLEDMARVTNGTIEKITQMMSKQGEMLAQLGNRLGCLEEGRKEKPQQDKEGEEDEVNHGKNGKIHKIVVETTMMKEKMEKMQQAFRKAQGMDGFLYTMGGLGLTPLAPLPPKFKNSDAEKFDGNGDPRQYIRQYLSLVGMKGLNEKQALCAFPMSLTGNASRWYYNLDLSKTKVWNELMELFVH